MADDPTEEFKDEDDWMLTFPVIFTGSTSVWENDTLLVGSCELEVKLDLVDGLETALSDFDE